jgi:hypothetical protein
MSFLRMAFDNSRKAGPGEGDFVSQPHMSLECRINARVKRAIAGIMCTVPFLFAAAAFAQTPTPLTGPGNAAIVNGRVEVDGQPFFPFGFFHVTHNGTEADLLNTLNLTSAAGFNTLVSGYLSTVDYGNYLDQAAQKGVKVVTEFGMSATTLATLISNYATKTAVLGWNIADDVDDGTKTHAQVQTLYTQARAADPRHLTTASGFRAPNEPGPGGVTIQTFYDVLQVAAIERYPMTYTSVKNVYQAAQSTVDAAEAATPKPAVLVDVQSFNWQGANGTRYPTAAEGRTMTYLAIAAGVKGIWYYTFFDSGNYLPSGAPALWTELKALVPEVKTLAPVLLNGVMTRALVDVSGDRFASYWTYQGRLYVIVINTSTTSAKSFSLPMPAGMSGPARPLFSSRPSGMTFTNGVLGGTVQPLDVHVYVLNESLLAPAPPTDLRIK